MEIILVLHNIRSTYNVGAILRTCDGLGVKKVVLSGYTPRVHDKNLLPHLRQKLDKEIHKSALGAEDMVEIYSSDDIISTLGTYREQGYQIVGLENNLDGRQAISICNNGDMEKIKTEIVLILGEEVGGIDYSLYDIIDEFIEIPMQGQKESLNVSVAAGIALFALSNRG